MTCISMTFLAEFPEEYNSIFINEKLMGRYINHSIGSLDKVPSKVKVWLEFCQRLRTEKKRRL